jgi:hypothetical protein
MQAADISQHRLWDVGVAEQLEVLVNYRYY